MNTHTPNTDSPAPNATAEKARTKTNTPDIEKV
jgi:hypothetical protein